MTYFRTCSSRRTRSQAPLCHYTRRLVPNQAEGTFARLRYSLGGDRPSQTTHQTVSPTRLTGAGSISKEIRVVFQRWLCRDQNPGFIASHLFYADHFENQCQTVVKVHGVFPSCRG